MPRAWHRAGSCRYRRTPHRWNPASVSKCRGLRLHLATPSEVGWSSEASSCDLSELRRVGWQRQLDGDYRPGAVGAIGCLDRAAHGLDEAAADRQTKSSTGPHAIKLSYPVELVEDPLEIF